VGSQWELNVAYCPMLTSTDGVPVAAAHWRGRHSVPTAVRECSSAIALLMV
jgi:hypothetical protein